MTTTKFVGPTRVYVGSLHFNITEDELRDVFSQYGDIEFIDLHKDAETGRSKGFGFIQYVFCHLLILLIIADIALLRLREKL